MFIFDFVTQLVMEEALDWFYSTIVAFFAKLFTFMNGMGTELLDLPWVQAIVQFFSNLGWALFIVGIVVAVFECAIEYQSGRGSIKDTFLNVIKGFFAVSLFSNLPIILYKTAIDWQTMLVEGMGTLVDANDIGITIDDVLTAALKEAGAMPGEGIVSPTNLLFYLAIVIAYGYAVIKVFFANLKRGGIIVIQIAVGSLYMFSIPRGYIDPFKQWMKTVIGLCLTAFLQSVVLTAGLIVFREHMILGLGMLLSATEVPRICGQFGLETGTKANVMGGVYAVQSVVNISKSVAKVAA